MVRGDDGDGRGARRGVDGQDDAAFFRSLRDLPDWTMLGTDTDDGSDNGVEANRVEAATRVDVPAGDGAATGSEASSPDQIGTGDDPGEIRRHRSRRRPVPKPAPRLSPKVWSRLLAVPFALIVGGVVVMVAVPVLSLPETLDRDRDTVRDAAARDPVERVPPAPHSAGGTPTPSGPASPGPDATATTPSSTPEATAGSPTASPNTAAPPTATSPAGGVDATPPAAPAPPPPIEINYADFSSVAGLSLQGAARRIDDLLLLTSSSGPDAGSAWSRTPIDPTRSFSTSFVVELHDEGADGIAFVLQSEGLDAIGDGGGGLGYGDRTATADRIQPSLAVEFDMLDNSYDPESGDNHIAAVQDGAVDDHLASAEPSFTMWRADRYRVWVTYDAGAHRLRVYASTGTTRPADPALSLTIDVASVLGTGAVYAGFTAAKGEYYGAQEILSWQFQQ